MFNQLTFKRLLHIAPKLKNEKTFTEGGIKGLMTPLQFKVGWLDYQKYLINKLNMKIVDTDLETKSTMSIAMTTSKEPLKSDIFHYASQIHNNHLFFEQLKDNSSGIKSTPNEIKPQLLTKINEKFGSFENFRNEFLLSADLLGGNGWVFLVEDEFKQLKIVSCNNEGTPYLYSRNQDIDLNTIFKFSEYKGKVLKNKENIQNGVKDYSLPLLVCNVWEFAYVLDYGVTGKGDYLEKFWDNINWNVINNRYFSNIES